MAHIFIKISEEKGVARRSLTWTEKMISQKFFKSTLRNGESFANLVIL